MTIQAIWNGAVLAESDETVVVEGNHYFPPAALRAEYFKKNSHQTTCPWKGVASYYDIVVGDARNPSAAWFYPQTSAAAKEIEGYVAFWKGIRVTSKEG